MPLLATLAAALLAAGCRTAPVRHDIANVSNFVGAVHVAPAGGRALVKAARGMPLRARDRVVTGSDAWAFLAFADGPKVLVGQGAEFVIEEETEDDIYVLLRNASLGAREGLTRGRRLTLRTPSAAAELRPGGCVFRLLVDAATGASVWDVMEGELRLRDYFGREVLVRAGQRVSADRETGFRDRSPQAFPPSLQAAGRETAQARTAGDSASLRMPAPPAPTALAAPADAPKTSTGGVAGMTFPPVPRFEDMDALLEELDWAR